jgi:hypothetical protein
LAEVFDFLTGKLFRSWVWQVQSYLAPRREWNSLQASLKKWNIEKFNLQSLIETEADPEKRQILASKVVVISNRIASSNGRLREMLIRFGDSVDLRFEL